MYVHILFYMCFLDTISVHASNVASYVCDHFRTVCSRGSLRMKPARWLYLSRGFLCCSCLSTRTTSLFVASLQDHQTAHFLVASNAAVGGPSTATTFAESLEWTELVVPAAVCGTLGYALGTPVAFAAQMAGFQWGNLG